MRQGWRGPTRGAAMACAALLSAAHAQAPARTRDAATGRDDNQLKLRGLQDGIDGSEAKRRALASDIAAYTSDRARFQASLIDTTRKVSDAEGRIADAEARLDALGSRQEAIKRSLARPPRDRGRGAGRAAAHGAQAAAGAARRAGRRAEGDPHVDAARRRGAGHAVRDRRAHGRPRRPRPDPQGDRGRASHRRRRARWRFAARRRDWRR